MGKESSRRAWVSRAVQIIEADFNRSSDTHLLRVPLPGAPGVALYLKDESTHPSGSLKHRLARSLFLYGLCNGWIGPDTTIIEASSGSTAVSEAYFARMLGLRFIAVMPRSTSAEKIATISFYGGESHFVDSAAEMYTESARLADGSWRPLHGPVHLRRARNGLARQQQHRRVDFQSNGPRGTCHPELDRRRGRNRRYVRHARAVHPLSASADTPVPCRSRSLRIPPSLCRPSRSNDIRIAIPDRGNWATRGASLPSFLI